MLARELLFWTRLELSASQKQLIILCNGNKF